MVTTFESLNDDTLTTTLQFVGKKSYKSFGGLNKHCREIYLTTEGMTKETFLYGYAPLSVFQDKIKRRAIINNSDWEMYQRVGKGVVLFDRMDILTLALQRQDRDLLERISEVAAEKGRIDLLNRVWNNVEDEDDKRFIFRDAYGPAARHGKLNVLKWVGTKGLSIHKECCGEVAAFYGHLHILQWLKEEKGFELNGGLYHFAIHGGQLHVMKWLREQEVPWENGTFVRAAQDDGRVPEEDLKPEVIDWLRVNGYGDRIELED